MGVCGCGGEAAERHEGRYRQEGARGRTRVGSSAPAVP